MDVDLRGGKSHTIIFVHSLEHVVSSLSEFIIEVSYRHAFCPETLIGVSEYFINCHKFNAFKKLRKLGLLVAGCIFATFAAADNLEVREDAPDTYTVKKGDTLWDISGHFLKKPWYWPKIWNVNPQIKDPHWIYPGDVLKLVYIDGKPVLTKGDKVVRQGEPIPAIDGAEIEPFVLKDLFFDRADGFEDLPFVMGDPDNDIVITDDVDIFVRGHLTEGEQYAVYSTPKKIVRPGEYVPVTYRAHYSAMVVAGKYYEENDQTMVHVVRSVREIHQGDKLVPASEVPGVDAFYVLQPSSIGSAMIVDTDENSSINVGTREVAVIDKGTNQGASAGQVLRVMKPGLKVTGDRNNLKYEVYSNMGEKLLTFRDSARLPDYNIGEAMIVRAYKNVSLVYILNAKDFVKAGQYVTDPE